MRPYPLAVLCIVFFLIMTPISLIAEMDDDDDMEEVESDDDELDKDSDDDHYLFEGDEFNDEYEQYKNEIISLSFDEGDKVDDSYEQLEDDTDVDQQGFVIRNDEILAIDIDDNTLDVLHGLGFTIRRENPLSGLGLNMATLGIPEDMDSHHALEILRQQNANAIYELNHLYQLHSSTTPRAFLSDVKDMPQHRVGLIDTMIDNTQGTFTSVQLIQQHFTYTNRHAPAQHGTYIAQLLAQYNHYIYNANVFELNTEGASHASAENLARAIDWLVTQQVAVINMSLAGPPNQLLHLVIQRATEKGHLIVAAVGNHGPAAPPLYPAAYSEVIAVTAIDQQQRIYRRANRGKHVEVAALGVSVSDGKSGTSFATPIVSSWLAQRLTQPDHQQAGYIRHQLNTQAIDLGEPGHDEVFGHGWISLNQKESKP